MLQYFKKMYCNNFLKKEQKKWNEIPFVLLLPLDFSSHFCPEYGRSFGSHSCPLTFRPRPPRYYSFVPRSLYLSKQPASLLWQLIIINCANFILIPSENPSHYFYQVLRSRQLKYVVQCVCSKRSCLHSVNFKLTY
jgi:hypothetical protein